MVAFRPFGHPPPPPPGSRCLRWSYLRHCVVGMSTSRGDYATSNCNMPHNAGLTRLLDLMFSSCRCVHSPMLWLPQSSSPTRAYVKLMEQIGRKYVRIMNTTL